MSASTSFDIPVLLIGFNRPDWTARALDAIRTVRPTRLLIHLDGPRPDNPTDAARIEETARIAERVDWPCDVQVIRQPKNLGCCFGPVSAIDWLFQEHEAGIILEDDCIANPTFFPFCRELLERYREDSRIGMVAGSSHGLKLPTGASYGFSQFSYIWGWATWRRAWHLFDPRISDWPEIDRSGLIEAILQSPHAIVHWKERFQGVYEGTVTSIWDFQWMLAHWLNRMACIVPACNLITNIGSGPDSTHMNPLDPTLNRATTDMEFPLVHPKYLVLDSECDRQALQGLFSRKPLHRRVLGRMQREVMYRARPRLR